MAPLSEKSSGKAFERILHVTVILDQRSSSSLIKMTITLKIREPKFKLALNEFTH